MIYLKNRLLVSFGLLRTRWHCGSRPGPKSVRSRTCVSKKKKTAYVRLGRICCSEAFDDSRVVRHATSMAESCYELIFHAPNKQDFQLKRTRTEAKETKKLSSTIKTRPSRARYGRNDQRLLRVILGEKIDKRKRMYLGREKCPRDWSGELFRSSVDVENYLNYQLAQTETRRKTKNKSDER